MIKFSTYVLTYSSLIFTIMIFFDFSVFMNVAIFVLSLAFIKGALVGNIRELYNLYLLKNMLICKKLIVLEATYIYIVLVICMSLGDMNNVLFMSINNIDIYINKFLFSFYIMIIIYRFLLMRTFEVVYKKLASGYVNRY